MDEKGTDKEKIYRYVLYGQGLLTVELARFLCGRTALRTPQDESFLQPISN